MRAQRSAALYASGGGPVAAATPTSTAATADAARETAVCAAQAAVARAETKGFTDREAGSGSLREAACQASS